MCQIHEKVYKKYGSFFRLRDKEDLKEFWVKDRTKLQSVLNYAALRKTTLPKYMWKEITYYVGGVYLKNVQALL